MEKMTEEQKQLVLKTLCEGLPYGLLCDRLGQPRKLLSVSQYKEYCVELDNGEYIPNEYEIDEIKPYLRPLPSMTEEERIEYNIIKCSICSEEVYDYVGFVDWLNAHHFDCLNLIEAGLALEAPEGMYITKSL